MIPLLLFITIITFSIGNKVQIFFKKDVYIKITFYVVSIASLIFSSLYFYGFLKAPF
jgi:hypothetical protein